MQESLPGTNMTFFYIRYKEYIQNIQGHPFEMSQKETETLQKRICFIMWNGNVEVPSDNLLTHSVWKIFLSWWAMQRLPWTLNHGLLHVFLPIPVTHSSAFVRHRPFSRNMFYHFTISRCEGTWWQLYWHRKAHWVLVTLEDFAYRTTHCAHCCGVTAMFVSHELVPPHGHAAEPPVKPPFTPHGHPSHSYSNKLLSTLTSCIQRFTFLTSQMDHSVEYNIRRFWICNACLK
jgi:hypothetical protein